jgi:hypothetical protein
MWEREKMMPKCELFMSNPLHGQGLNVEQMFVSWKIMLGKNDGV